MSDIKVNGYIVVNYHNCGGYSKFSIIGDKVHTSIKTAIDSLIDELLNIHNVVCIQTTDEFRKTKYTNSDICYSSETKYIEWDDGDDIWNIIQSYGTKDEFRNYVKKHLGFNKNNKYCLHDNNVVKLLVFEQKECIYVIEKIGDIDQNKDYSEPLIKKMFPEDEITTDDLFLEHKIYKFYNRDKHTKLCGLSTKNLIIIDDDVINGKYTGDIYVSQSSGKKIKQGKGILYFNNGDVFSGEFLHNEIYSGEMTYKNGNIFKGNFKNNKIYNGEMTYNNGNVFNGEFKDNKIYKGKLNYSKYNNIDGYFYEGMWKNGEKHGIGFASFEKDYVSHKQKWDEGFLIETSLLEINNSYIKNSLPLTEHLLEKQNKDVGNI